jgi:peroxiredoxin/tetratricopeptide (TPR) repeat protein
MTPLARLAFAAAFGVALAAQEPATSRRDETYGHSRHGTEFDEGPRRAPVRMAGLNEGVRFPVAGLDAEAQAWFDQGVCQQHGFWYLEAERSFREVARRHPECAMAFWGIAMANVEHAERAAGFAAMAVQRAAGLPERERLYVDAIAAAYQIDAAARTELQSGDAARAAAAKAAIVAKNKGEGGERARGRALLKGLEAVVFACPDDVEAKAFLAIQSWRNVEAGIEITSHGAVDALLDQVFARVPLHSAHHYRVHLWDKEKAERALRSAAVLGDTAPAIAHQWHMAGHVYAKLDRHHEAAWQQEASARVDHAYMARERVLPFAIHNYAHNQEWLARSLTYVGEAERALAVAVNLAAVPRHPKWNRVDDDQHCAGYARARIVQVCEDLELWQRAVELCTGGHVEPGASVKADVQRLGLLGRALFRLGRLDEAERVVAETDVLLVRARAERAAAIDDAEAQAHAKKEPPDKQREAIAEAGRKPSGTVRAVLDLQRELRAERLLAQGDAKAALAELEAVPDFPKTLLADALVAAGEAAKAIELLEREVKEKPKRVPTLARLLLAYIATADAAHAERMRALAEELAPPCDGAVAPLLRRCRDAVVGCAIGLPYSRPGPSQRWADEAGEPLLPQFPDDFGHRPRLASLGPLRWAPFANAGFDLPLVGTGSVATTAECAARVTLHPAAMTSAARSGGAPARPRAFLVVFYLGFGCLQCVEQLHALVPHLAALEAAGVEVLAIGNDGLTEAHTALAALPDDKRLPFPLLADPKLAAFRAWHCFDDFEDMPLHGTFLVDADGFVRWQDVGAQPFTDFAWLRAEAARLLALRVEPPAK